LEVGEKIMNILVLASDYPITTRMPGSPRLFNLCRRLAKRHRLSLAFFPHSPQREESFASDPDNRGVFQEIYHLPSMKELGIDEPKWFNRQRHRISFEPYFSLHKQRPNYLQACRNRVGEILREKDYGLLYVNGMDMSQYVATPSPVPLALDFCDCDSRLYGQKVELQRNPLKKMLMSFERRGLMRWEKQSADTADLSIVISSLDEEGIRRSSRRARTLIVPNGIDGDFFSPRPATEKPPGIGRLIFTGVMRYGPNADAAIHFGRETFPLLRKRYPSAEFWVVGADPPDAVRELSATPGIVVTGTVDDIRPYLHRSDAFVCPLRYGVGMKNKILAALAMKIPVIATSNSVLGVDAVKDEHLLLAETPEEFTERASFILENPRQIQRLVENGRKLIEEKYSWDFYASLLEQAFLDLSPH
jgi:glycosyltransferase involved in cell wall biosynthesis